MENVLAIMGIDPGGKTGVAQALFHTDEPTVEQAFKSAMYKQSHTVEGRIREQIIELNNRWRRFYREMVGIGVAPNKVLMCVEDYISTPGIKADDPLSPIKIGWGHRVVWAAPVSLCFFWFHALEPTNVTAAANRLQTRIPAHPEPARIRTNY